MRCARRLSGLVLALGLAGPATAQVFHTVDAQGGADFTSIGAAIAAAAPGDRILVAAGNYAAFTLDRHVVLLGASTGPRPKVAGLTVVSVPAGAFVANLELQRLAVLNSFGTLRFENVFVFDATLGACPSALVQDSERVVFESCFFIGQDGTAACDTEGLVVRGAYVVVSDTNVFGGKGYRGDPAGGRDGRPGLLVEAGAVVDVPHSLVIGGAGGNGLAGLPGGDGAPAMRILPGCLVRAVSHPDHGMAGGAGGLGSPPGAAATYTVDGGGTVTLSSITMVPAAIDPALAASFPVPEQAFLRMIESDDGGRKEILKLFGTPGQPQLVLASLVPAAITAPALVDGLVWLDPGTAFLIAPVIALGLEDPVNFSFPLPSAPALLGTSAVFQAFSQVGGSPPWRATNPSWILLD